MINEKRFWELIDQSRGKQKISYERQIKKLTKILTSLSPEEIVSFEKIFSDLSKLSCTWELWAAAYIINGGCSDDTFDYFRSWLIGRGETVFYKTLDEPEILKELIKPADEYEWEGLGYCATNAYEQVTGQEMPNIGNVDEPTQAEPTGRKWQEDELPTLYPQLWKKFSGEFGNDRRVNKPKVINPNTVRFTYTADRIPPPAYWIEELKKCGHDVELRIIGEYGSDPTKVDQENYAGYLLQLAPRITKNAMGILIKDLSINKGKVSIEFETFDKKLKDVFRDLNSLMCEQMSATVTSGDYELTTDQWKQYLSTGQLNG